MNDDGEDGKLLVIRSSVTHDWSHFNIIYSSSLLVGPLKLVPSVWMATGDDYQMPTDSATQNICNLWQILGNVLSIVVVIL